MGRGIWTHSQFPGRVTPPGSWVRVGFCNLRTETGLNVETVQKIVHCS